MLRARHCALAAALITLTFTSCQDSVAPLTTEQALSHRVADPASLVEHQILPRETGDDSINWVPSANPAGAYHDVWLDPTNKSNPKLLVFMPGTSNRPSDYVYVAKEAASLGYHVIGLMFQNNVGIDTACKVRAGRVEQPPADCSGDTRLEVLEGQPYPSSRAHVTRANGIYNRLTKVLIYLSDTPKYEGEGWSRFLELDEDGQRVPKWSQIAVAGHSQGAGQAALIAKLWHVNRVVMLSGPPDSRDDVHADAWVSIGKTPAAKYFALFHSLEPLAPGIRANLNSLNMYRFGDPVFVTDEADEQPFRGTHILTIAPNLLPRNGSNFHGSTARDLFTPLSCTVDVPPMCIPVLAEAWRYLLGEPPNGGADKALVARIP
jgi:hypothetical protein